MVQTILNVLLILLAIAAIVLVILYFLGSKLQKRQAEQQQMLDAAAQTVSILVIDKKEAQAHTVRASQDGSGPDAQVYALGQSSRCKSKDRSQGDDSDRRRRSI